MNILWFTWKDYTHPQAGGAETVLRELSSRLVAEGHHVSFLTVRHPGSAAHEIMDGIEVIRIGTNRYLHPFQALAYYLKNMRNKYDAVIEVVNTAPYFGALFKGTAKGYVFCHQLAREIWFHELKKPFSSIGYHLLEPVALRLLSKAKATLITVSDSTRTDLEQFGFSGDKAYIISEGIEIEPLKKLRHHDKFAQPTLLSLGAMRAMKRTLDQVQAFEAAKQKVPELKMILAGDTTGEYGERILQYIAQSPFSKDISVEGRVSTARKIELMRRSHVFAVTSVKEGWGLVVTEAASQGTPAVVYDVDGLRDSVRDSTTGIVCKPTPDALAAGIVDLLHDNQRYEAIRRNAWEWSKEITFDQSYRDFKTALELA
jgi:glycosyltransferase involved in cell wall biosynthesis